MFPPPTRYFWVPKTSFSCPNLALTCESKLEWRCIGLRSPGGFYHSDVSPCTPATSVYLLVTLLRKECASVLLSGRRLRRGWAGGERDGGRGAQEQERIFIYMHLRISLCLLTVTPHRGHSQMMPWHGPLCTCVHSCTKRLSSGCVKMDE